MAYLEYTVPVGLEGEHRMRRREAGVRLALKAAAVSRKLSCAGQSTMTGLAPASLAISG